MIFINKLRDGDNFKGIYYCKYKSKGKTKNNKDYDNVQLQDKTGVIDAKVWEPNSFGINEYEVGDFVEIMGDVQVYNNALQVNIKRLQIADKDDYDPCNYFPSSKFSVDEMYDELKNYVKSIKNEHLKKLAESFYFDSEFEDKFKKHSAAKNVHHSFIGGLTEHTLRVTQNCDYLAKQYIFLNRDLMICGGLFHDIGKLYELSDFPMNDYTDIGQLIGHISYGAMMLKSRIDEFEDFPELIAAQLLHCILAHHGELLYGSPKKPAMAEAVAINMADTVDAKLEIFRELFEADKSNHEWLGYNKFFETNIRRTRI